MSRKLMWGVLANDLALVVVLLGISIPTQAADGEPMMKDLQPITHPASVERTADP